MQEIVVTRPNRTTQDRRLLWLLLFVPVVMSLSGVWILDHTKANKPLFSMTNLVGPTTRSLLAGEGLTACTEDMGTRGNPICFHAARMPMSALAVALGMRLFGDHYLRVACFKTLLFFAAGWSVPIPGLAMSAAFGGSQAVGSAAASGSVCDHGVPCGRD